MAGPPHKDSQDQPLFEGLRRRQRSGRPPGGFWVILVIVVLAGGAGAWFWWRGRGPAEPETAAQTRGPDTAAHANVPAVTPLDLPPLEGSDSLVRKLVGGLSARPRLAAWLVTDDLVRRFVAMVVNLAAGASPTSHLEFLAPAAPFRVRRASGRLTIDAASYRRYDLLTGVVVSLDTEGSARLYRQLHPLFEDAYRELGITAVSFDSTMAIAMGNLLAVPVPDGPIAVQREGDIYRFADPGLEALTPAAKHLLRFGPDNARRIQAKLRELADAVGIVPAGLPAGSR